MRSFFSAEAANFAAEHADFARESVADLRAAAARYPDDEGIHQLVADLSAGSQLFRELWSRYEVDVRHTTSKRVNHPVVGELELDCQVLHIPDRDQRLMLYTVARGTPSRRALEQLKVVSTRDFSEQR